jgi:hypothetical protein
VANCTICTWAPVPVPIPEEGYCVDDIIVKNPILEQFWNLKTTKPIQQVHTVSSKSYFITLFVGYYPNGTGTFYRTKVFTVSGVPLPGTGSFVVSYQSVLWIRIRIRKDLKLNAGSGSVTRGYGSGSGFGSETGLKSY